MAIRPELRPPPGPSTTHPDRVATATAGCRILVTFSVRDFHPGSLDVAIETPAVFVERVRHQLREIVKPASGPL